MTATSLAPMSPKPSCIPQPASKPKAKTKAPVRANARLPMPSHPLLHISELVLEIIDYLPSSSDKLHFALTCKTAFALTVPSIWNSIDRNAVRALVRMGLDEEEKGKEDVDWPRFLHYAQHVRSLELQIAYAWNSATTIAFLRRLSLFRPPSPVFPALESLQIFLGHTELGPDRDERHVHFFVSHLRVPSLKALKFVWEYSGKWEDLEEQVGMWHRNLDALRAHKQLEVLKLVFISAEQPVSPEMGRALQAHEMAILPDLPVLRDVELTAFDAARFFDYDSVRLPGGIDALMLHIVDDREVRPRPPRQPALFPPTIRTLSFQGRTPLDYPAICTSLSTPCLSSLDLGYELWSDDVCRATEAFGIIASRYVHSFRRVAIDIANDAEEDEFAGIARLLRPLLVCGRMESVCVSVAVGEFVETRDADVDLFTAAWPGLREFLVQDQTRTLTADDRPVATARSLALFAARCPRLRELELSVDFDAPFYPLAAHDSAPCFALREWRCSYARCKDPERAAGWVGGWFPCLGPGGMVTAAENEEMVELGRRLWR